MSVLDIRSFRGGDCDTDYYLVVAKVEVRLTLSEQAPQKIDVEEFNFRKLNGLYFSKQYQIEISNRFAGLENLRDSDDVSRAWENFNENIKSSTEDNLGVYEWKHHGLMKSV